MSEPTEATNQRRPLSVKLRFDVFKRDAFTCQYCGAHPPAVVLECDHIMPVAEGGKNDFYNLVTACADCNRGKGATPLHVVPQTLAERAAEVAEREAQIKGYAEVMEARRQRLEDDAWEVLEILFPGKPSVPRDTFASTKRFIEKLGKPAVMDAADAAMASRVPLHRAFKYFCGICWNRVREQEGEV